MKNLLYKEMRLALHPTNILFIPLAMMLFIPNYPYLVVMFYTCLGIFFMCQFGRENNDVFFTLTLPVEKRRAVLARITTACMLEIGEIIACVPIALIKVKLTTARNYADMDVNIALFALAFMMFGLFNIVFFPGYYKNVKKVGKPFVFGSVAVFAFIGVEITLCYAAPFFKNRLDTPDPQYIAEKLVLLAVGIAAFFLLTLAAYKLSAKRFERQDI